jgi:hypothetical protein
MAGNGTYTRGVVPVAESYQALAMDAAINVPNDDFQFDLARGKSCQMHTCEGHVRCFQSLNLLVRDRLRLDKIRYEPPRPVETIGSLCSSPVMLQKFQRSIDFGIPMVS